MKISRAILAAGFLAMLSLPAFAAGMFQYPAGTSVTGNECIPADTNLTQGLTPATECLTPGQINGLAQSNAMNRYSNIPIGGVAYGSWGTNTTPTAGTIYWSSIQIPVDITVSAIACLQGGTAATDLLIYGLWNNSGTLLMNTALAGTLSANADTFQSMSVVTATAIKAGRYWVGWQTNGTTTRFRTVATATYITVASSSATGTFGTLPTLTVPTSFTADKAPICYVVGS